MRVSVSLQRIWQTSAVLVCALLVVASPALAVEPERAASLLARQAAQAEEAGDLKRAAEAYLAAYRADPKQPNYLYAAARAEMVSGQRAQAMAHLEEFLEQSEADTERSDKARAYLAELRAGEQDEPLAKADRAAQSGRWSDAARLYYSVWDGANTRWSALFKAGVAAHEAEDLERAEQWLHTYLREAPKDVADRPEAEARLKRVRRDLKLAGGASHVIEPLQVSSGAVESHHSGRWTAGWVLVGTGVAMVLGGGGLAMYGTSEESALTRDLKLQDGFVTAAISHAEAQERADAIAMHQTLGVALLGTGLAASGAGVVLLLLEPDRPARSTAVRVGPLLAAGVTGMQLGWRF